MDTVGADCCKETKKPKSEIIPDYGQCKIYGTCWCRINNICAASFKDVRRFITHRVNVKHEQPIPYDQVCSKCRAPKHKNFPTEYERKCQCGKKHYCIFPGCNKESDKKTESQNVKLHYQRRHNTTI